jgi:nitrate/TMAO reductase-like tetraheme cytochrome c subunit
MRILSFITFTAIIFTSEIFGQSPHGDLKGLDCAACHESTNWKIDLTKNKYDHTQTGFALTGQHRIVNCSSCHIELKFSNAQSDCNSCHKDIHQNTVSSDCSSCHKTDSWLIANKNELHQNSRFPLLGSHLKADCIQCHIGYPNLKFAVEGIECIDCHRVDYQTTQNPNHTLAGFSTDCLDCHSMLQDKWSAEIFAHNFFPLTGGHNVQNCFSCHQTGGNFKGLSTDCYSCHQSDYEVSLNPPHASSNFPTTCKQCHTIQGWKPASFDHNATQFPLTGAHLNTDCANCHKNGYVAMPSSCVSCHETKYNSTTNPNHSTLSIPNDCQNCHTTNPGWKPATFSIHDNFYQLIGAHAQIKDNCAKCHNGNYSITSNTCYGCHTNNYNTATNPPHASSGFNTDCQSCHSQNAWKPANWDHDGQYFPIYSGKHMGKWNICSECHTVQSNYSVFSCIDCHEHAKTNTDEEHQGVSGYVYASNECFSCHPRGTKEGSFNHATSIFPLTGAHQTVDCNQCHKNGYANTPTNCYDCHQSKYNGSTNPNHSALSISTDCFSCHTTSPAWKPAQFPQHDTYFALTGAHQTANCSQCHNGNYTNISNTCVSCHQTAYNAAVNPNHTLAGIATACESCHNSNAWVPSSFKHITTGFDLTGQHSSIQCSSCHKGTTSGLNSLCMSCHQADYNSAQNHLTQGFPTDCEMCHNAVAWNQTTFNHNNTIFQLTGAHITTSCSKCHTNGFTNTPTECSSCHINRFNNATNPNHVSLNLSNQCQNCHTTNPGWKPATFSIHNNFFQLIGAHATIQNNCSSCHKTGYTNTPKECYGCHQSDYINTTNPPHQTSQFPTDCLPCHSQNAWTPATFDHDGPYFPIYTGSHRGKWSKCSDCHTNPADYKIYSCIDCHEHNRTEMDSKHHEVNGYIYSSIACFDCHPRGGTLKSLQRHNQKVD